MKLTAIVGTNADFSLNRKLLHYMRKHFAKMATIEIIEIKDIPLFNTPEDHRIPPKIAEINKVINNSEGVIIATPEYDHSIPAALKNLLEWLSYDIHPFHDKPVMIVGASYGKLGSSRAQLILHQILRSPELKAQTLPGNEFLLGRAAQAFDSADNLKQPETIAHLEKCFENFYDALLLQQKVDEFIATTDTKERKQ